VFVKQIGCFDRVCLLLGLEVGEWFFGGPVCQSVRDIIIRGGLRGSNNQLSLIGQIFGTNFYVAYVNGQLRYTWYQ
jgi:hypothetical protein